MLKLYLFKYEQYLYLLSTPFFNETYGNMEIQLHTFSNLHRGKDFSLCHQVQISYRSHTASYPMGTGNRVHNM
jgi:hypothetical protein